MTEEKEVSIAGAVEITTTPDPGKQFIAFTFDPTEEPILLLKATGEIYVHGRLAANDQEVVDALRRFIEQASEPR